MYGSVFDEEIAEDQPRLGRREMSRSPFVTKVMKANAVLGMFALLLVCYFVGRGHSVSTQTTTTAVQESTEGKGNSDEVVYDQITKMAYPGYPECAPRIKWMQENWNKTEETRKYYKGVDGSTESILEYLNEHGLYCPTLKDATRRLIRGVNLGGWLVLEPWIRPSLFEQFDPADNVKDMWSFCEKLGRDECRTQLRAHFDEWVTEDEIATLAAAGITHVRIPVGYWILGDIREGEPWVNGGFEYLQRAMLWLIKYNMHAVFDLHCAPGSQNGFDNSGRQGPIHWADPSYDTNGNVFYPNLDRSLTVLEGLVTVFSLSPFKGTVTGIELVNEAFITIPIDVVKLYYTRAYEKIRNIDPTIEIIIGDSFRFGEWENFMYPPEFNHVYIDTHIYQVFDEYRLSMSFQDHIHQTCTINLPQVAIAPLSTVVGEWCASITDCAQWLNGYNRGSRYDGTFVEGSAPIGTCEGQNDVNSSVYTPEFRENLRRYVEAQMEAYETGSSSGWFFWNFKTERAPQWNYLLGLEEGWIPKDPSKEARKYGCHD